jgi:hypothetical protein
MMPVKAVQFLFVRMKNLLLNPGKTFKSLTKSFDKKHHLDAKKALKDVQPKKLTPIFTKNALELIEKSSKELGIPVEKVVEKLGKDPVITRKFKETYGEHLADLLSDEKASYDGATASTWFKMTALITIPLKVIDAYNVSQSKDGDTSMSAQKAKERLGQDLTRHGLSTWITAGFNTIFREVSNRSILGASVVAGTQTIVSEVLTRVVAGVAVLPKTRDQLIDMEDKTLNAKGLKGAYYRFMSGVTGRKPLRELTKNHNNGSKQDKDNLDDELPTDMFTTKSHKQYSPSADKLYIDSAFARLKNSQN